MDLIACQYRAAEWRHKEVELAAHDLLQHLDKVQQLNPSWARRALACSSSLGSCRPSLLSLAVASRSRTAAEADQRNPA
jgi:hypothetical protein